MNRTARFTLIAFATVAMPVPLSALRAADDVKLESNAKITWEFPDLPATDTTFRRSM